MCKTQTANKIHKFTNISLGYAPVNSLISISTRSVESLLTVNKSIERVQLVNEKNFV